MPLAVECDGVVIRGAASKPYLARKLWVGIAPVGLILGIESEVSGDRFFCMPELLRLWVEKPPSEEEILGFIASFGRRLTDSYMNAMASLWDIDHDVASIRLVTTRFRADEETVMNLSGPEVRFTTDPGKAGTPSVRISVGRRDRDDRVPIDLMNM